MKTKQVAEQIREETALTIVAETMDKIDRNVYNTIEIFKEYVGKSMVQDELIKSNNEFAKLKYIDAYIDQKDKEWIFSNDKKLTPFTTEMLNTKLSKDLLRKINFYGKEYGFVIYGESFITNRYGANLALTDKTSDYKQSDEDWWVKAKNDGLAYFAIEVNNLKFISEDIDNIIEFYVESIRTLSLI